MHRPHSLEEAAPSYVTQRQCRPTRHGKPSHSNLSYFLFKLHLLRHGQPPQAPHRPLCMSMLPLGHRCSQFSHIPSVTATRSFHCTVGMPSSDPSPRLRGARQAGQGKRRGVGAQTGVGLAHRSAGVAEAEHSERLQKQPDLVYLT